MKFNLVLLIVGFHFITLTHQESDFGLVNISFKKKCSAQQIDMRLKLSEYYDQLCGTATTTPTTTTTTTTTTTPCGVEESSLVKMYQLYNSLQKDHFYTNSSEEADRAVDLYGYERLPSPGEITLSQTCTCKELLVPVYRSYDPSTRNHFYTATLEEYNDAVEEGSRAEGISWYCSPTKDVCGATLALYKFTQGTDNIYVTNNAQATGATYTGTIVCYIWPA